MARILVRVVEQAGGNTVLADLNRAEAVGEDVQRRAVQQRALGGRGGGRAERSNSHEGSRCQDPDAASCDQTTSDGLAGAMPLSSRPGRLDGFYRPRFRAVYGLPGLARTVLRLTVSRTSTTPWALTFSPVAGGGNWSVGVGATLGVGVGVGVGVCCAICVTLTERAGDGAEAVPAALRATAVCRARWRPRAARRYPP